MKLDNFPLALWINMDSCSERREYMENLMFENNIKNVLSGPLIRPYKNTLFLKMLRKKQEK